MGCNLRNNCLLVIGIRLIESLNDNYCTTLSRYSNGLRKFQAMFLQIATSIVLKMNVKSIQGHLLLLCIVVLNVTNFHQRKMVCSQKCGFKFRYSL